MLMSLAVAIWLMFLIVRSCTRYIVVQLVKMRGVWYSVALISGIVLAGHVGPVFNQSVSDCLQVIAGP